MHPTNCTSCREVPCTFTWEFISNKCKYEQPKLSYGPPPPVPKGCQVLNYSTPIIRAPQPPRTDIFGGWSCELYFPAIDRRNVDDPQNCAACPGFIGYPPNWPQVAPDDRYGPVTSITQEPSGNKNLNGHSFTYLVIWRRLIRCKNRSGQWGPPRTQTISVNRQAKWTLVEYLESVKGYTVVSCRLKPCYPPDPRNDREVIYVHPDERCPF